MEAMSLLIRKISFLLELFFSGTFLWLYSLGTIDKIPKSWNGELVDSILSFEALAIPWIILLRIIVHYMNEGGLERFLRKHVFSFIVFVSLLLVWGDVEFSFILASVHLLSSVLALYEEGS